MVESVFKILATERYPVRPPRSCGHVLKSTEGWGGHRSRMLMVDPVTLVLEESAVRQSMVTARNNSRNSWNYNDIGYDVMALLQAFQESSPC